MKVYSFRSEGRPKTANSRAAFAAPDSRRESPGNLSLASRRGRDKRCFFTDVPQVPCILPCCCLSAHILRHSYHELRHLVPHFAMKVAWEICHWLPDGVGVTGLPRPPGRPAARPPGRPAAYYYYYYYCYYYYYYYYYCYYYYYYYYY